MLIVGQVGRSVLHRMIEACRSSQSDQDAAHELLTQARRVFSSPAALNAIFCVEDSGPDFQAVVSMYATLLAVLGKAAAIAILEGQVRRAIAFSIGFLFWRQFHVPVHI